MSELMTLVHARPKRRRTDRYDVSSDELKSYINRVFESSISNDLQWIRTSAAGKVRHDERHPCGLVNLTRLNDIAHINPFLEDVNRKLPDDSVFVVCLETKNQRKKRILEKFPRGINKAFYTADFILKRVMPKVKLTRYLYLKLTNGRNRVMTKTEALGRLICCGFQIIDTRIIGNQTYIITKKTGEPHFDRQPTYGALCRLKRIGKKKRKFTVYKLRTMHPYSEYLQSYIYSKNGTEDGNKINGDYRITSWGQFFRKLWIDEIPMLVNYVKGDMKLVGVRPLSEHKFYTYPEELQEKRTSVKPGLIPPAYADLPETAEEFFEVEERYLEEYKRHPYRTDMKYFFRVFYNIIFKRVRSL